MPIIHINSLEHAGTEIFHSLTEAQLRNRLEPEKGIFIAESPKVIRVALDAGYQPVALLTEERHIKGDAAERKIAPMLVVSTTLSIMTMRCASFMIAANAFSRGRFMAHNTPRVNL